MSKRHERIVVWVVLLVVSLSVLPSVASGFSNAYLYTFHRTNVPLLSGGADYSRAQFNSIYIEPGLSYPDSYDLNAQKTITFQGPFTLKTAFGRLSQETSTVSHQFPLEQIAYDGVDASYQPWLGGEEADGGPFEFISPESKEKTIAYLEMNDSGEMIELPFAPFRSLDNQKQSFGVPNLLLESENGFLKAVNWRIQLAGDPAPLNFDSITRPITRLDRIRVYSAGQGFWDTSYVELIPSAARPTFSINNPLLSYRATVPANISIPTDRIRNIRVRYSSLEQDAGVRSDYYWYFFNQEGKIYGHEADMIYRIPMNSILKASFAVTPSDLTQNGTIPGRKLWIEGRVFVPEDMASSDEASYALTFNKPVVFQDDRLVEKTTVPAGGSCPLAFRNMDLTDFGTLRYFTFNNIDGSFAISSTDLDSVTEVELLQDSSPVLNFSLPPFSLPALPRLYVTHPNDLVQMVTVSMVDEQGDIQNRSDSVPVTYLPYVELRTFNGDSFKVNAEKSFNVGEALSFTAGFTQSSASNRIWKTDAATGQTALLKESIEIPVRDVKEIRYKVRISAPDGTFVYNIFRFIRQNRHDHDLNNTPDLVLQHPVNGTFYLWTLDGPRQIGSAPFKQKLSDPAWRTVGTSDFNSDGKPDLLLQHPDNGTFYLWYMDGPRQIGSEPLKQKLSDPAWRTVGAADFNGDGHPDILLQHPINGTFYLWYMDGPRQIGSEPLKQKLSDPAWRAVGTSDFNGDGHPDILLQHPDNGTFYLWYMDGPRQTGSEPLKQRLSDKDWVVSEIADFNYDGKPDLLLQHQVNGTFYLWYMDGPRQIGSEPLKQRLSDKAWRTAGESYWSVGGWEASEGAAAMSVQGEELRTMAVEETGLMPEIGEPLNEELPKIDTEAGEVPAPEEDGGGGCNAAGPISWGFLLLLPLVGLRKGKTFL